MQITLPSSPTYLYHPKSESASTATLFLTLLGRTDSLYSSDCFSNTSIDGILTTLTSIPAFLSSAFADTARFTSEPLAIIIPSGVSLSESSRIYAPLSASFDEPAICGRFCLVRTKAVGSSLDSIAYSHASAVSVLSHGLNTVKSGIERNAASCSIGSCVGPSSPTPILSCVNTYISGSFISDVSLAIGFV